MVKAVIQGGSNGIDRRLATTEVALGMHPDDAATVRATVDFQQQRLVKSVKESWDVLMYPCFSAIAFWAGWAVPLIIAALDKKVLEFYLHKIYHDQVLVEGAKLP